MLRLNSLFVLLKLALNSAKKKQTNKQKHIFFISMHRFQILDPSCFFQSLFSGTSNTLPL